MEFVIDWKQSKARLRMYAKSLIVWQSPISKFRQAPSESADLVQYKILRNNSFLTDTRH